MKVSFFFLTLTGTVYNTVRAQSDYYYDSSYEEDSVDDYYGDSYSVYDYGSEPSTSQEAVGNVDENDYAQPSSQESSNAGQVESIEAEPSETSDLDDSFKLADEYMNDPNSGDGSGWEPWMGEYNPEDPPQNQHVEGVGDLDPSTHQLELLYLAPSQKEKDSGTVFEGFSEKDPDDMVFIGSDLDREFIDVDIERNLGPVEDGAHTENNDLIEQKRAAEKQKRAKNSSDRDVQNYQENGGVYAFDLNDHPVHDSLSTIENCDRGADADNNHCISAMRVELIKNRKLGLLRLYAGAKYARAEACLIFSGLTKDAFYFQRNLLYLKRGYPVFCDKDEESCQRKHRLFAACNGVTVCADACWSEQASVSTCNECQAAFCTADIPNFDKFLVCGEKMEQCKSSYPTSDEPGWWNGLSYEQQQSGRENCWGASISKERNFYKKACERWNSGEICQNLADLTRSIPYPEWQGCYAKCKSEFCDWNKQDQFDPNLCEMNDQAKQCLNSNNDIECLTEGSLCAACNMDSLYESGMFSRKSNNGKTDSRVPIHVGDALETYSFKATEQMTGYIGAQLLGNRPNHKVCNRCQHNFDIQTCMFSCEHAWKWRNMENQRNETFEFVSDVCKSTKCGSYIRNACSVCIDRSVSLGYGDFQENYNGFGCALPCKNLVIHKRYVGEYRTDEIGLVGQTLMDIISASPIGQLVIDDVEAEALADLREKTKMNHFQVEDSEPIGSDQ